jgi:hypothetical protein
VNHTKSWTVEEVAYEGLLCVDCVARMGEIETCGKFWCANLLENVNLGNQRKMTGKHEHGSEVRTI